MLLPGVLIPLLEGIGGAILLLGERLRCLLAAAGAMGDP
jgi:hypothetical protein